MSHLHVHRSIDNTIKTAIKESLACARRRAMRDPLSLLESEDHYSASVEEQEKQTDTESKLSDIETLKSGDVSSDDIINKLNSIRAGRSFKDDVIKKNLDDYITNLNKAEKTALLAYLKGIEQIVSGQISGSDATEPRDPEPNVDTKKKDAASVKKIKPTIVHKPTHSGPVKKSGGENTAPPLPVKVKK
jgi:hypothetical protein